MNKSAKGWVVAGAVVFLSPLALHAQDAGTAADIGATTPPELRDFRLDSSPPRAKAEPDTPPRAPDPAPATNEAPRPSGEGATTKPASTRLPARQIVPSQEEISPSVPDPLPETQAAPETAAPSATPIKVPETAASDRIATAGSAQSSNPVRIDYRWILIAVASFVALAAAVFLSRRRRLNRLKANKPAIPALQPSPPVRLEKPETGIRPQPPQTNGVKQPHRNTQTSIVAEYRAETAQLSIASLSVTGKLSIINQGSATIDDLLMRSHMISAHAGQQQAIEAFHTSAGSGSLQGLGSLAIGERIDATVEIRLPRDELASFRWTEREFVAPIILINLSGSAGDQKLEVRISQLIGRQGASVADRMKPLAVDRGPRRFTGISTRPLFT